MANDCKPQIHACMIRVSRLDASGVPLPGANNLYVSDALTIFTVTPDVETGERVTLKNGCNTNCLNFKEDDKVIGWNVELNICTPDPQLHELLAGGVVLTSGAAVGYGAPFINTVPNENGVSIELWSERVESDGSPNTAFPYARWGFPRVRLIPGARSHSAAPHESPFTGFLLENANFYNGPANDWPAGVTAETDRPWFWLPTNTIPTASCGYQTLVAS